MTDSGSMGKVLWASLAKLVVMLILLAFLAGVAGIVAYSQYQRALGLVAKPIADPLNTESSFILARGSSLGDFLNQVQTQQPALTNTDKRLIQFFSRWNGEASALKAGRYPWYDATQGSIYTVRQVMEKMIAGETVASALTIPEGITVAELRERIGQLDDIQHETTDLSDEQLIQLFSKTYTHPEGLFLADTYFYDFGSSDKELLQRAYDELQQALEEAWSSRATGDQLAIDQPYEALILASLIEKETGVAAEREQISGVFQRRLNKGMRLQTDPAVIYGLGAQYRGKLYQSDLDNDTPYNTYRRHGLPPTPIALVGKKSLFAAVSPDQSRTLYFVADGAGGHSFAETLAAHNANVRAYRATIKQ